MFKKFYGVVLTINTVKEYPVIDDKKNIFLRVKLQHLICPVQISFWSLQSL